MIDPCLSGIKQYLVRLEGCQFKRLSHSSQLTENRHGRGGGLEPEIRLNIIHFRLRWVDHTAFRTNRKHISEVMRFYIVR